jgi:hypothetical protein
MLMDIGVWQNICAQHFVSNGAIEQTVGPEGG